MARWRALDRVLLVAVVALVPWAWGAGCERAELEATYARLAAAAGELDVDDPGRIYLRAMPTGDPLRFAWRFYFPPGRFSYRCGIPGGPVAMGSSGPELRPREGVFQLGFRERRGGACFEVSVVGEQGGQSLFGDPTLVELLRGRWDRVEVEQAAATGPVAVDAGTPLTLVRLRLPPDLVAEARSEPAGLARTIPPVFFEFTINPPGPP